MIKIAILTWFLRSANYGQTLQAYAISYILRQKNYLACFFDMDLTCSRHYESNKKNWKIRAMAKTKWFYQYVYKKLCPQRYKRYKAFQQFVKQRMPDSFFFFKKSELEGQIKEKGCRAIVCGSDQIWNPNILKEERNDIYFANFPYLWKIGKISYAPSTGNNIVKENAQNYFDIMCKNIHKFNCISVREESGIKLIQESWGRSGLPKKKIKRVLDPVLLLTAEEWKVEIENGERKYLRKKSKKEYLLCYFVGEYRPYMETVKKISQERSLPIFFIEMDTKYEGKEDNIYIMKDIAPDEFVELLSNASYVIGDSYHAMVFSILFEKEYVLFQRTDKQEWAYETDDRLLALSKLLDTGNRFIQSFEDYQSLTPISYGSLKIKLEMERKKSLEYLFGALHQAVLKTFIMNRVSDEKKMPFRFPDSLMEKGTNIILYGAGDVGTDYWCQCVLFGYANVVLWLDRNADKYRSQGLDVEYAKQSYDDIKFDYCLIAIYDGQIAEKIKKDLMGKGIPEKKLIWRKPESDSIAFYQNTFLEEP